MKEKLIKSMIDYYSGDPKRINHFIKVYGFAKSIGELQGLDKKTQDILEIAAITHDIGIKNSEQKYNSSSGHYQQLEGPPEALKLLQSLCFDEDIISRVCYLIAHHHTYDNIIGEDYRILVEADFIVNAYEDKLSLSAIKSAEEKIFKTENGKAFLNSIFNTDGQV